MTTITYENIGGVMSVRIEGHAGYATNGDPVCAACSILQHTLIRSLDDSELILYDDEIPASEVRFNATPKKMSVFDTILTGFRLLEECYPDNVKMRGEI